MEGLLENGVLVDDDDLMLWKAEGLLKDSIAKGGLLRFGDDDLKWGVFCTSPNPLSIIPKIPKTSFLFPIWFHSKGLVGCGVGGEHGSSGYIHGGVKLTT